MEKQYEVKVLKEVTEGLKKQNIKYWLTDGSALKLYRDNTLFPSTDFDFAMFADDIPQILTVCEILKEKGYTTSYQNGLPFVESLIEIFPPNTCSFGPISFNIYNKNNNEAFSRNFDHPFRKEIFWIKVYSLGFKLQEKRIIKNQKGSLKVISFIPKFIKYPIGKILFYIYECFAKTYWNVVPMRFFNSLRKVEIFGLEFFIPEDIVNFLEYRYGSVWKTPVKNWDKFACQQVRIRRLNYYDYKVKKYKVKSDNTLYFSGSDIFAFNDSEIEQIILRDKV